MRNFNHYVGVPRRNFCLASTAAPHMPKVKTKRVRTPKGFEVLEDTLQAFETKMREAENDDNEEKRKDEVMWPIFRIHHQRSRYIYQMYYDKKEISKEVYQFCLDQKYADANLIAKWKKNGYERLCCLKCIQGKDTNYGTTCICRVPRNNMDPDHLVECKSCGCRGCSSSD